MLIWKYTLLLQDRQSVPMPAGAKILTVQMQGSDIRMWALVEPYKALEPREIAIYGTGNFLPDNPGVYIGTFQMEKGMLIFHAFDLTGQ